MREAERDALLITLAAASGSADGWSYLGLAHAFVANMTGNTVLLGIAILHVHGDVIHPLVALAGYVLGTLLGTLLTHRVTPGAVWRRAVSRTLLVEAALLIAGEAAWVSVSHPLSPESSLSLLGMVAVAIGIQSGAMIQLRVPGVVTTYITGTWTTLTNGVTRLVLREPRIERHKRQFEERFALQAAVLGAYLASAVLTGWAFGHARGAMGCIPAAAVLLVGIYGLLRD